MNRIKINIQQQIIKYIINNFSSPAERIDIYLNKHIDEIVKELKLEADADDIFYEIGDIHNINSKRFIELLSKEIKNRGNKCRIKLVYNSPFYYMQLSGYGEIINTILRKQIENKFYIFNDTARKGYKYQKFCAYLLYDYGFKNIKSKYTDDNGVDIFASYNTNIQNNFLNYFNLLDTVIALVQVKCYKDKIGTSIIKALVKDSWYLRVNENENMIISNSPVMLIVFSNSGFNEKAIKYAKENKIYLISSDEIIDMLCITKNVKKFKCMEYINSLMKIRQ